MLNAILRVRHNLIVKQIFTIAYCKLGNDHNCWKNS